MEDVAAPSAAELISLIGWPLWLILFGWLLSIIAGIWLIIVAFKESVLWGLAVLIIPFAALFFIISHWSEAKNAFLFNLFAIAVLGGGVTMAMQRINPENPEMQEFIKKYEEQLGTEFELPENFQATLDENENESSIPEPTPVAVITERLVKEMQRELVDLEASLNERKASLDPEDKAAADQLTLEILEYNKKLEEYQQAREQLRSGKVIQQIPE